MGRNGQAESISVDEVGYEYAHVSSFRTFLAVLLASERIITAVRPRGDVHLAHPFPQSSHTVPVPAFPGRQGRLCDEGVGPVLLDNAELQVIVCGLASRPRRAAPASRAQTSATEGTKADYSHIRR